MALRNRARFLGFCWPLVVLLMLTGLLALWPASSSLVAQGVSALEKDVKTAEAELSKLKKEELELSTKQAKNQQDQAAAESKGDADSLRKLKSAGDEIGRSLNRVAANMTSKIAAINELRQKIRNAAQKEVTQASEDASKAPNANLVTKASAGLKSWSAALNARELPSHSQERLPARANAESRQKAGRELERLNAYIKALEDEGRQLDSEEKSLKECTKANIEFAAWASVKSSMDSLLKSVQAEQAIVKNALKLAKERKATLEAHLR
ncbi:MAG: hypothetical protein KDB07_05020 [Planctomycetes bacterium]|nr:hypothetical protein [Planctomycetota bacterium]